jgi:ferredoxin
MKARQENEGGLMNRIQLLPTGTVLEAPQGASLAEVFSETDCGITIGCGAGACGSCKVRVLSEPATLSPLTEEENHFLETATGRVDSGWNASAVF